MIPLCRIPSHPGEILRHEFLIPKKMAQVELAQKMGVSVQGVNALVNRKRSMTANMAILLSRVLGTTPEYWMSVQSGYALALARKHLDLA